MNWTAIALFGASFIVLLNVFATVVALRSDGFLRSQIRNQVFLVWVLPLFGAAFVILFHRSNDDEDPRDDGGNSSDMTDRQLHDNVWSGGGRQ